MTKYLHYTIYVLKLYQAPNLIDPSSTSIVFHTETSGEAENDPYNLIRNLDSRVQHTLVKPLKNKAQEYADHNSCFWTEKAKILIDDRYKFILSLDLGQSFFQHAVLLVESVDYVRTPNREKIGDWNLYLMRITIYIGDDPDWTQNPTCPGSPFLTKTGD